MRRRRAEPNVSSPAVAAEMRDLGSVRRHGVDAECQIHACGLHLPGAKHTFSASTVSSRLADLGAAEGRHEVVNLWRWTCRGSRAAPDLEPQGGAARGLRQVTDGERRASGRAAPPPGHILTRRVHTRPPPSGGKEATGKGEATARR
jgi:hypothetical protein